MHLITIKLILCHKPFPWLNSLGFFHEPVCDRDISTYCTYIVLESRRVRIGESTCSGGSSAVYSTTRELLVHPTCVQALSRNWWGVNTSKSGKRGEKIIYLLSSFLFRRFHSSTFLHLRTVKMKLKIRIHIHKNQ